MLRRIAWSVRSRPIPLGVATAAGLLGVSTPAARTALEPSPNAGYYARRAFPATENQAVRDAGGSPANSSISSPADESPARSGSITSARSSASSLPEHL
jgi:hypothetical protein